LHPEIGASAGVDLTLDCTDSELTLGAIINPSLTNFDIAWDSEEGNQIQESNTAEPIVTAEGVYIMTVVSNESGCSTIDTIEVTDISIENTLDFNNQETEIEEGQTLELSLSTTLIPAQIGSIIWSPSETVTAEDGNNIYVPNTFQPSLQPFRIFDNQSVDHISINIFDRWGNQVHEAENVSVDDPSASWDGRYDGKLLSAGVYIYRLHLMYKDGQSDQIQGSLTLIN